MRKIKTTLIALVVILIAFSFINVIERTENHHVIQAYTPHSPITINDDLDFIGYAFPGTGDPGDPYIISGYSITFSSSYGIRIYDITKHFIIQDCLIENQGTGIYIDNVPAGAATILRTISQNNNVRGIWINDCDDAVLVNNTFLNNHDYGMFITTSDRVSVFNNTCSDNGYHGIRISYCDTPTVQENTCFNNGVGLEVGNCISALIDNNWCYQNSQGMQVGFSDHVDILTNNIHDNLYNGLFVSSSEFSWIFNNTCNNNEEGIYISGAGTSEINNNTCSYNTAYGLKIRSSYFSTISYNNFTANGLEIDESMIGFYLVYTLHNNTINNLPFGFFTHLYNETIIGEYGQFLLVNCSKTTVENKNELVGIKLFDSPNNLIISNQIENSSYGIQIIESEFTEIYNNSLTHHRYDGIYVSNSDSLRISNNTVTDVEWGGIHLSSSPSSEIKNNTLIECRSISLSSSNGSKFLNNTLTLDYGVDIASEDLEVKNNIFHKGGFNIYQQEPIMSSADFENNWIKGLPFGFFRNVHDSSFSTQYGQLYLINCDRITVSNQMMENVPLGIFLDLCDNSILQDNQIINGGSNGIVIYNSSFIDVINTTCDNFWEGIFIQNSQTTLITQSKMLNCFIGLEISWGSNNNQITHNLLKNNTRHGIEIQSDNNVIHHNNFIDNRHLDHYGFAQAKDTGTNNIWYDDSINEGNFWNDWSGVGSYMLDGGAIDPYPLGSETPINIPEFSTNSWIILIGGFFFVAIIPIILRKYKN